MTTVAFRPFSNKFNFFLAIILMYRGLKQMHAQFSLLFRRLNTMVPLFKLY